MRVSQLTNKELTFTHLLTYLLTYLIAGFLSTSQEIVAEKSVFEITDFV